MSNKITVPEQAELDGLLNEVWQLKKEWLCFEQLFMHSDEQTSTLFANIPALSDMMRITLCYSVVMTLCRLTDKRSDTLTLVTLAKKFPAVQPGLDELTQKCNAIRHFRNKCVGHRDKAVASGTTSLTPPELGEIRDAVDAAELVAIQIGKAIDGSYYALTNYQLQGDIKRLIYCLAYGALNKREMYEFGTSSTLNR